ncbi:MAG TPA: shikimate dehydrogenase [Flavipsychrobacter sp.]|nr:shikimate dehydrogenase [Flavipsychrobacter sp.]
MASVYGILGYPLSHSFSPAYFKEKFDKLRIQASYRIFELENIHLFPDLLKSHPYLCGLNVTIPHKQTVIEHLDTLSDAAAAVGAVNCIDIREGLLRGYNTDVIGFEKSLRPLLKNRHRKALILGNGGASLAVQFVLKKLEISYLQVSRSQPLRYEELSEEIIKEHLLIINTTPLGMYPHVEEAPAIPYRHLTSHHLLYDLIYNPEETRFLLQGKEQGAAIKNGFEMLKLQADASWDIWSR